MAQTTLTDSDGHTVPNIRWSTQFAQVAGAKYVAGAEPTSTSPSSPVRLPLSRFSLQELAGALGCIEPPVVLVPQGEQHAGKQARE
jgi:hypothetical protein